MCGLVLAVDVALATYCYKRQAVSGSYKASEIRATNNHFMSWKNNGKTAWNTDVLIMTLRPVCKTNIVHVSGSKHFKEVSVAYINKENYYWETASMLYF